MPPRRAWQAFCRRGRRSNHGDDRPESEARTAPGAAGGRRSRRSDRRRERRASRPLRHRRVCSRGDSLQARPCARGRYRRARADRHGAGPAPPLPKQGHPRPPRHAPCRAASNAARRRAAVRAHARRATGRCRDRWPRRGRAAPRRSRQCRRACRNRDKRARARANRRAPRHSRRAAPIGAAAYRPSRSRARQGRAAPPRHSPRASAHRRYRRCGGGKSRPHGAPHHARAARYRRGPNAARPSGWARSASA